MIRITISVDKGGQAKTTTAVNMAAYLSNIGKRVLLVDTDQQCNLTSAYFTAMPEVYTLLNYINDCDNPNLEVLPYHIREGLDIIPASHRMFGIGVWLVQHKPDTFKTVLIKILSRVENYYDFVIVDTPPSDNILMINALNYADKVLMVTKPDKYGVMGVMNFHNMVEAAKESNPRLEPIGILITDCEPSTAHQMGEDALRKVFKEEVFKTKIRHSWHIYTAMMMRRDVFEQGPKSNGAKDYADFCNELLERLNNKNRKK